MKHKVIFIAFSAVVLGFLNFAIYEKEMLLKEGELVYLELVPVDPRSLMQGDFMQLRFDIVNSFALTVKPSSGPSRWPSRGRLIVQLDENNIGTSYHYFDGDNLGEGEKLFRYTEIRLGGFFDFFFDRSFGQRIKIVPDTYFFQEGHAQAYAAARYGVFKFGSSGDYLLVGLADENLKIIEAPLE